MGENLSLMGFSVLFARVVAVLICFNSMLWNKWSQKATCGGGGGGDLAVWLY